MVEGGTQEGAGEGLSGPGAHAGCLFALRRLPQAESAAAGAGRPPDGQTGGSGSLQAERGGALCWSICRLGGTVGTEAGGFGKMCVDFRASWKLAV